MQSRVQAASSPQMEEVGGRLQLGKVAPLEQDARSEFVDLKGRPVDKSKTGRWFGANLVYILHGAEFGTTFLLIATTVRYMTVVMHQDVSKAATDTNNFAGTCFLLSLLGGFLADAYLGCFWTVCLGAVALISGLGLLTFSSAYSGLQPADCTPMPPLVMCPPAGGKYMAPLFVALYIYAVGVGLVEPNMLAVGGNQFDESPKEKKQSVHFFVWYFFTTTAGAVIALGPGVYLHTNGGSNGIPWAYGAFLILTVVGVLIFVAGVGKLRHKKPTGSFLTRVAQVIVAAVRKHGVPTTADGCQLYNPQSATKVIKLPHTNSLRFLDKAAVPVKAGLRDGEVASPETKWRLCTVTQVEETKRIIQMLPIWLFLVPVHLVYAQFSTFTVQQAQTLDRSLGSNFTVPAASIGLFGVLFNLIALPIYDRLLLRVVAKFTKHPFGFSPLQRMGSSIIIAILTMMTAALVEKKRLGYVRDNHYQELPLGAYSLDMSMWWLLPQFCLSGMLEFLLFVPSFEFFFLETSTGTRSIGSSFPYSDLALGNYFSTVLVKIVNRATKNDHGGSWTGGKLNNGGLRNIYWLLCIILAVDFVLFVWSAMRYQYKYDWYHKDPHGNDIINEEEDSHRPSIH